MGKKGKRENIVVGLDIGTTKICAIVAEVSDGGVDIVGIGTHPSKGLRKGVVINIDATVESIRKAVEEAELMAGVEINSVYCGITGSHIRGFNSHGIVAVKNREVSESDMKRVIDAARAVAIPMDREIIHVLPQEFIVDEQDGIMEPLGMSGVRLEAKVHIVTGAVTSAQNIIRCCNRTGLEVNDIVLEQLAASDAVLIPDEKELGVALADIGGGTTDLVVFSQGAVRQTAVFGLGGNHLTNDIAVGLRTPLVESEKIKIKYGCALTSMVKKEEMIEVPSVGGRRARVLSRQILAEIIEPRMEEIFTLVHREILKSGYENLIPSGVVLTGGTASLEGLPELVEQIFNLPVRRGYPSGIGGLMDVVNNPMYAAGVGLVLYGRRHRSEGRFKSSDRNFFGKVAQRMKRWFSDFF
ncbi:MAG: cell division protein FtsA [Deltaproteobacteria bacterium]|jgi:cell division protein FtsA|nr:cell division protein FtsA [Deltaproteobacteria bacterium]MDO9211327.1 cell division protein FtsA [Deltaproteobacteria bacterium]